MTGNSGIPPREKWFWLGLAAGFGGGPTLRLAHLDGGPALPGDLDRGQSLSCQPVIDSFSVDFGKFYWQVAAKLVLEPGMSASDIIDAAHRFIHDNSKTNVQLDYAPDYSDAH